MTSKCSKTEKTPGTAAADSLASHFLPPTLLPLENVVVFDNASEGHASVELSGPTRHAVGGKILCFAKSFSFKLSLMTLTEAKGISLRENFLTMPVKSIQHGREAIGLGGGSAPMTPRAFKHKYAVSLSYSLLRQELSVVLVNSAKASCSDTGGASAEGTPRARLSASLSLGSSLTRNRYRNDRRAASKGSDKGGGDRGPDGHENYPHTAGKKKRFASKSFARPLRSSPDSPCSDDSMQAAPKMFASKSVGQSSSPSAFASQVHPQLAAKSERDKSGWSGKQSKADSSSPSLGTEASPVPAPASPITLCAQESEASSPGTPGVFPLSSTASADPNQGRSALFLKSPSTTAALPGKSSRASEEQFPSSKAVSRTVPEQTTSRGCRSSGFCKAQVTALDAGSKLNRDAEIPVFGRLSIPKVMAIKS